MYDEKISNARNLPMILTYDFTIMSKTVSLFLFTEVKSCKNVLHLSCNLQNFCCYCKITLQPTKCWILNKDRTQNNQHVNHKYTVYRDNLDLSGIQNSLVLSIFLKLIYIQKYTINVYKI